jgi:hypothetical protein
LAVLAEISNAYGIIRLTMPGERQPHNHPESQPMRSRGGDAIGTQPSGRPENPQLRIIQFNAMINKDELPLFLRATEAVTQAGLGMHRYAVSEYQTDPYKHKPLEEDSPFLAVTYTGQENRNKLNEVIIQAKEAKIEAEQERRSQREIDRAVGRAITRAVNFWLRLEDMGREILDPPEISYKHVGGRTLQEIKDAMAARRRINDQNNNPQQQ